MEKFEVIVVGAGHAGCEAALAASRLGLKTLIITLNCDEIALTPCNPAIGGLAKSHLVKEIDALGGEMAKAADSCAIQFRLLNTRKGPAVRATRAQIDKHLYSVYMKKRLGLQPGLFMLQGQAVRVLARNKRFMGVQTQTGEEFQADTAIVTTGTYMEGKIHIGLTDYPGGRSNALCSHGLSGTLSELGFRIGRLKTGTPARLDEKTIDWTRFQEQKSEEGLGFSFDPVVMLKERISCYYGYTNKQTHEIIRNNLDKSPLYSGKIKGIGPRYCPSIEDKIVKFSDRTRHQIFLEKEGLNTNEIYLNGMSTSLPINVQAAMISSVSGLENARIIRPAYAVEYDFIDPTQLLTTLESKIIENLFFAGQVNGTSGYEEAAAQGLIAGINAALKIKKSPPLEILRHEGYIGVLIDDLVTKGTDEPYRMFTSRAEYRLMLREDNADLRLREKGYGIGLISKEQYEKLQEKKTVIREAVRKIKSRKAIIAKKHVTLDHALKMNALTMSNICSTYDDLGVTPAISDTIEAEIKYEGYIKREREDAERIKKYEKIRIPTSIDYSKISSISNEVREKLMRFKPQTLAQAMRIPGLTPAAVTAVLIYLKKKEKSG